MLTGAWYSTGRLFFRRKAEKLLKPTPLPADES